MTIETEEWKVVREFPDYLISNMGNVYNQRFDRPVSTSLTNHGHVKVSFGDREGGRHTRSVGLLVAEVFVPKPHHRCDHIIPLDGNVQNVAAYNLAWRPRGFAWQYMRQLKIPQREEYSMFRVCNTDTDVEYSSIIEAGINEGLLFVDIWKSTYSRTPVYPTNAIFEPLEPN